VETLARVRTVLEDAAACSIKESRMRSWPAVVAAIALPATSWFAASSAFAVPQRPGTERPAPSPLTDHFALRGSFFTASPDTKIRLDSSAGTTGDLLSGENDFALDDRIDQGRIELMFRMGKTQRNKLRVDYFKTDRYGDTQFNRTVAFGDNTFNVNERVVSSLDIRMLSFTDTYALLRNKEFELSFGLGIHVLDADVRGEVPARQVREEASGAGAFPTFALDTMWTVTPRIAITGRGQYFSTSTGSFSGLLSDYHGDVQFRWRPNMAFGLGYSATKIALDVQKSDFPGRFAISARGPEAFVRVSF
jgi:hypothetical protein